MPKILKQVAPTAAIILFAATVQAAKDDALQILLDLAGADSAALAPDPIRLLSSSASHRHLPFYRALMSDPLRAGYRAGMLESTFRSRVDSPHRLMLLTTSLAGADVSRGYLGNPMRHIDNTLLSAEDPLATGLAIMIYDIPGAAGWSPILPEPDELPGALRLEIGRLVAAVGQAERFRRRAFSEFPEEATPSLLLRQAVEEQPFPFEEPDFRRLLHRVEKEALHAGMLELVGALEDLDDFFANANDLPSVSWSLETPLGWIVIDTTGDDNRHELVNPLLVIDIGGNDVYTLANEGEGSRIRVLYDRGGNDRYSAETAACASSAVMGYGILWDTGGDDTYEGGLLAQGAALFGAAMHFDGGGDDVYTARGYSQSFALGGAALLVSMGGDDQFTALTHSQACGAPEGAAVLINTAGNDIYTLGNEPLIRPSAQLNDRNTSMGQGAGTGLRADLSDGRSAAGGIGALFDLDGDDVYTAQVFAQGVGFLDGAGILVDGGGSDRFSAAWYGMAASAHRAAGILISRGDGDDVYTASHYTSISAAHDFSISFFIDEGGNDQYSIDNLGIGAANENGTALFIDVAGDDVYTVRMRECLAFGGAKVTHWGSMREDAPNIGLFMDLGGNDVYNARREGPANDSRWTWPRQFPDMALRSEAGAGIDGEFDNPFHTSARTPPAESDRRILQETHAARRAYRSDRRYPSTAE